MRFFLFSGVDYFRPLNVNNGKKVWVALFTSMSFKAVHLEVANFLFAKTFIDVFRRFVSRKCRPSKLVSNNGKQFVLANKVFCSLNKNYLLGYGINWTFVTEHALGK